MQDLKGKTLMLTEALFLYTFWSFLRNILAFETILICLKTSSLTSPPGDWEAGDFQSTLCSLSQGAQDREGAAVVSQACLVCSRVPSPQPCKCWQEAPTPSSFSKQLKADGVEEGTKSVLSSYSMMDIAPGLETRHLIPIEGSFTS